MYYNNQYTHITIIYPGIKNMANPFRHKKYTPKNKKIERKYIFSSNDNIFKNNKHLVYCHCGGEYNKKFKFLHLKTKTHINWVNYCNIC